MSMPDCVGGAYVKVNYNETVPVRDMVAAAFASCTIATPTTGGTSSIVQFRDLGEHDLSNRSLGT